MKNLVIFLPEQHYLSSGPRLFPESGPVVGAGSEWESNPPSDS